MYSERSNEVNWGQTRTQRSYEVTEVKQGQIEENKCSKRSNEVNWGHMRSQRSNEVTEVKRGHSESPGHEISGLSCPSRLISV